MKKARRMMLSESVKSKATQPSKPATRLKPSDCWTAIQSRDKAFAGAFVFSVATTGIYCRPSCPARLPKRENVEFYATAADAEHSGFRACKRCKPNEPSLHERYAATVAEACRRIERADEPPKLDELAHAAGLSSYHFHRVFKSIAGLTPKAYATAHRHKRVRDGLKKDTSVTVAIHDAGFNSSGRFYAQSNDALGMTPTEFRAGGANAELRLAVGDCSLGSVLVASSDKGIAAIHIGDDPETLIQDLKTRFPRAKIIAGDRAFDDVVAKVVSLVDAPEMGFDLPLDIRGTAFQHRVWQALREIPAGVTATYTQIAERIGKPKAVRAVAAACAANKIAVAIPCHRVVHKDDSLSGYRWGVARKRALLDREARQRHKKS